METEISATGQISGTERQDRVNEDEITDPHGKESRPVPGLPLDQVFEILRNQRRRYVLQILHDVHGPISMGELAEQIAAWENDKEIYEISSSERKRVYVGLYQAHLPKMDGMNVVSFNKPRGIIERGENFNAFDKYIGVEEPTKIRPWYMYYAGLSVASLLILIFATGMQPVTPLPVTEAVIFVVVSSFALCSLANYVSERESDESTT